MICTYLIEKTKNQAIPGAWLTVAAAISLTGALIAARRRQTQSACSDLEAVTVESGG
jgi:hypothetical protein